MARAGAHRPHRQVVRAPRHPHPAPWPGLHALVAARHDLGGDPRCVHQRRRPLRLAPAEETRQRRRALPHMNRARDRLRIRVEGQSPLMFGRIRLRLTLWYVSILILIVVLFGTIVVLGFRYQVTREQDNLLAREAESKQGSSTATSPAAQIRTPPTPTRSGGRC